jgi:hypothetical protein
LAGQEPTARGRAPYKVDSISLVAVKTQ